MILILFLWKLKAQRCTDLIHSIVNKYLLTAYLCQSSFQTLRYRDK